MAWAERKGIKIGPFSILRVMRFLEDENDRINRIDSRTIKRGRFSLA